MSVSSSKSKIRSKLLREEVFVTELPSRLKVYFIPKRGLARKVAIFATRYGSIDLEFATSRQSRPLATPPGIAHFLEHQLFKKHDRDILMEFGRYGASSNAFTNYTSTAYYFSATDHFEPCLDMLLNLVFAPYFSPENVAKEKLIIEQELRMYDDSPDYKVYKNLMSVLYRKHPVRIDIGGSVESIQKIDRGLLEQCYRVFYHPSNMVLVLCGDLSGEPLLSRTQAFLEKNVPDGAFPTQRVYSDEPSGVERNSISEEAFVSRPLVLLGFKDLDRPQGDDDFVLRELSTEILLDILMGKGSPFYHRLYDSGLIDDSFSFSTSQERSFGFSTLGGETDHPDRLADQLLKEIKKTGKASIKKKDLERARRKRLGKFLRAFDTADDTAFLFLSFVLYGLDIFRVPSLLKRVDRDMLMERLETHLDEKNCARSVILPKKVSGVPPA